MMRRGLGLCVLAIAMLTAEVVRAGTPPSPATVLANVQRFYANASQLTASFRQTVTNATFNRTQASDGQLWVLKPSGVRCDYMTKRNGEVVVTKSFISDGTTLWFVDHANKQIVQSQPQSSILPAAVSFLTGGDALTSQFAVTFDTSGRFGTGGSVVLELTPSRPSAQYQRLLFVIDPADWHVRESIVVDSSGDTNHFRFFAPSLDKSVKPGWFQVNPSTLPTYRLVQPSAAGSAATPAPAPAAQP